MKRISALLLAILLLLTQGLVFAEEADEPKVYEELVVGNPTKMQGYFFTELWGNSTTDIDVRMLLHGYNLVTWDGNRGMFAIDRNVVREAEVLDQENGDRSYVLTLFDDL